MTGMSGFHVWTAHECVCSRCGNEFRVVTMSGPSRICGQCTIALLEIIHGRVIGFGPADPFGNRI